MKVKTRVVDTILFVLFVAMGSHNAYIFNCAYKTCVALETSEEKRAEIVRLFSDHSIYRRGSLIILWIHNNKLKNAFYFEQKRNGDSFSLAFLSDSLEFQPTLNPDVIGSIMLNEGNKKSVMEAYTLKLVSKMDSLKIKDIAAEFSNFGIDLEVYFTDWSRLLYVSNLEKIHSQWKSFVAKAKRIDEKWYYYCEL